MFFSCGNDEAVKQEEVYADNFSSEDCLQKGKVLFATNCKICHSIEPKTPTNMGPVLVNIKKNWSDKEKLQAYIKNAPAEMQKTERSREIYTEWKDKAQMPAFAGLSSDEIDCIINFLYKETQ
jgi:cytochrome c2